MKIDNDAHAQPLFERIFRTKKDRTLVMDFAGFLEDITGLEAAICLTLQKVDGKEEVWASYSIRDNGRELFVFTHFHAKSIIATLNALYEIFDYADQQPEVHDVATMLAFLEAEAENSVITQYIVRELRDILIFTGLKNPAIMQHFLDTRAHFAKKQVGVPDGITFH